MATGKDLKKESGSEVQNIPSSSSSPASPSPFVVKRLTKKAAGPSPDPRMADPVFAKLAQPNLPPLSERNRAWLQIQSPSRLFFYWSIKSNPYEVLKRAFPTSADRYTLVAKLTDLSSGRTWTHAVAPSGDWWFDVDAGRTYRAEIGFEATARPFIRIVFSNTVETPRTKPSARSASESEWATSAELFSRMLDGAGYALDAVAVSMSGGDSEGLRNRTLLAFGDFIGSRSGIEGFDDGELRYALLLIAAGTSIEDLRGRISAALFEFLLARKEQLSTGKALAALREHFEICEEEGFEETVVGPRVHGASSLNMPRLVRKVRKGLAPLGASSPARPSD